MNVRKRTPQPDKATVFALVLNTLEIVIMAAVVAYLFLSRNTADLALRVKLIVAAAALVTSIGAFFDIRDALSMRRLIGSNEAMESTISDMETLNNTLRVQRHDFLNHLQVVYSLIEMKEYGEANAYIEKVYGEITAVSRSLKTANPSINALLQVKLAAFEREKVRVRLDIRSAWKDLPVPGWEMCKVLSNLLDNALDALRETEEDRELTVTLTEDLHAYRFSVGNTGPMIPVASRDAIFEAGVTTKSEGHGMGLYIVRETLRRYGGEISLEADPHRTVFSGWVPKEIRTAETEKLQAARDA